MGLRAQVFVTAQARTLDLATCLVQDTGVLVVVSASMRHALHERLDKYILYGDEARHTLLLRIAPARRVALLALDRWQYSC